ncbi:putative inactive tyrosine-protein kinase Wsck [Phymastichus coffea]|uniref:putative inactive tyrosine-protein kinase Wsck n=1 Tax=Phymastichus coffea TaxID=108790 RepID=UPI00273C7A0D|nr:putative inactive tyrosine-protein kinase Wsck [Phymastichus coffea]
MSVSRRVTWSWLLLWLLALAAGQQSIGCFKSSPNDPDLPVLVAKRVGSPEECIRECKARYFIFSGLMNGHQCYCGSHYGKNGPSDECKDPCIDDSSITCGSNDAINVYSTGQKGPSPPRRVSVSKYGQDFLKVIWQLPDVPNGKIVSYTLKASALETKSLYPLAPIEAEVQGESANSTTILGLHPGTKYNITIFATNTQGSSDEAYTIDWTRIGPPNKPNPPKIITKGENTITIEIPPGTSENGPITYYHVIVVQSGTVPPTGSDVVYDNYDRASKEGLGYYITGKFDISDYAHYKRFVVGDGRMIGGYYNAPLEKNQRQPQIGIALESRVRGEVQYSYSNLANGMHKLATSDSQDMNFSAANTILWVLIVLLAMLLLASMLIFVLLRKKFEKVRMQRLPEQQELTLQGPVFEVDNTAYIPEDIPERTNHYEELKNRVWSIPRNFLNFDTDSIRCGRFWTVHMGTVQRDGIPVAVAVHKILDTQLRGSEKRKMLRELDICIKAGNSKYLAGLVGNCEIPHTLFVALEMPPQNLKTRLIAARSGENFPHDQMLKIGAGVAEALRHLESLKIVHTCVCARSVGLNNDWTPKLMGHGLSKNALKAVKYARWTAIECFNNQTKHQPGVVWAYGVLLWEIFSLGGTPYSNVLMDSDVEDLVNAGLRLHQLMHIPDSLYEVMSSCWLVDPLERPTFDELVRLDTLSICPVASITEPYLQELELNN